MSKYFDGELLSAYEDLNKEFECKKENVKLHQQISDLEAKLAEKEEKYNKLFECYQNTSRKDLDDKYRLAEENEQLKQQLAEKENELTILKLDYEFVSNEYDKLVDIGVSKFKQHNQDKISFAVEQLKRVEKLLLDNAFNDLSVVLGEIDNQIKQLKEMK